MLTLASCCLVPIIINSVLVSFRQSLSLVVQDLIALMQHSMAFTLSLSSAGAPISKQQGKRKLGVQ